MLTYEEYMSKINDLTKDDVSDEGLELVKSLSDTYKELEALGNGDYKSKFEKAQKETERVETEWRNKYREAFFSGPDEKEKGDVGGTDLKEEPKEIKTFEDLFTTEVK